MMSFFTPDFPLTFTDSSGQLLKISKIWPRSFMVMKRPLQRKEKLLIKEEAQEDEERKKEGRNEWVSDVLRTAGGDKLGRISGTPVLPWACKQSASCSPHFHWRADRRVFRSGPRIELKIKKIQRRFKLKSEIKLEESLPQRRRVW